jgi:hypothetical protein
MFLRHMPVAVSVAKLSGRRAQRDKRKCAYAFLGTTLAQKVCLE